ncbi:MAG: M14 family metallopeptidase [Xenococcus sp. (in: cyanobacteria)]
MSQKYFVTIYSPNKYQILALGDYNLDLFRQTAKVADNGNYVIEGLLTLDEIAQLVKSGYQILVREEVSTRARAPLKVRSFQEYIAEEETLGYLSVTAIESLLQQIANTYSSICECIPLPNQTHQQRTSRFLQITSNQEQKKPGVLLLGGVHAREIVNPDLLVILAEKLCKAYSNNTGLVFGENSYSKDSLKSIIEKLDIFIFPLVNPDGRAYVQSPGGNPWWRKNRNPNPSLPCEGVDLNRNYDFLWESGIGTSSRSCSDIYKGHSAFSEPETKNVIHLLDTYTNIRCMVDVHSYSELILYPWGDDDNQTADPAMNFQNSIYHGLRGTLGDSLYKEYIDQADLDWYKTTGTKIRDAIAGVRGRNYTLNQSAGLYPTTATSIDYAYARHFKDSSPRKIFSFTLETGQEFQPTYSEALKIMEEVSAGLIECCLACVSDEVLAS